MTHERKLQASAVCHHRDCWIRHNEKGLQLVATDIEPEAREMIAVETAQVHKYANKF